MSKKHLKIFIMTVIGLALIALIGTTYAYFQVKIIENKNEKSVSVISKILSVKYEDGTASFSGNNGYILPGDIFTKTFTVTNTGNDTAKFNIVLRDVKNEFTRTQDLTYELKVGETIIAKGIFPTTKQIIYEGRSLSFNSSETYILKLTYAKTTESQNEDINKTLQASIDIESQAILK